MIYCGHVERYVHELLAAPCFIILTVTLMSASVQDIRTREVSDIHWMVIGAAGIVLMIAGMYDQITAGRLMVCAGSAMLLSDIFYEKERPPHISALFYAAAAMMFAIPALISFDDAFVRVSMIVPVCYLIFLALYFGGVIKGGADVKCLISMTVMFPVCPLLFGYPVISVPSSFMLFFPFPLAVLFHASLFSVAAMFPMIMRNVMRGDTKMPNMLIGYRTDARHAAGSHVWPMDNGASDDGKMWVTPKIPFIVPITAAVLFVAFAGNILFLI